MTAAAFAIAALLLLPIVALRGRTLATYAATDAVTWGFAWLVWNRAPVVDPYLAAVALAVLKLATFCLFLARGLNVRWSANRAALLAAIVYVAAIPAMLRTPIDGDEPFYLLVAESLLEDRDLDLANQYASPGETSTGRSDLGPQFGDPVGPQGERYSRHEPFLPLLLVPGTAAGGLIGAIATIALFGVLLVRSTVRWMEEEGIDAPAIRAVFPFFAFAPPVLFYAVRIWPEVPAAFFFVEALRGVGAQRPARWLTALFGMVLLKLRFLLVAAALLLRLGLASRRGMARIALPAVVLIAVPTLVMWLVSGDATSVHGWQELIPVSPARYASGLAGLLTDGMAGIAFQAPFYLFGLAALFSWRFTPAGFRAGIVASLLYLFYLIPRDEWFGGWAPPLRYLVFLTPVLALGAASIWGRIPRAAIAVTGLWTAGLATHGLSHPWRLFHIFNGENAAGEWLSRVWQVDVSRLFPSFIRPNAAAWPGFALVLLLVTWWGVAARPGRNGSGDTSPERRRATSALVHGFVALALAGAFVFAQQPPERVEFEDAHVVHRGGALYPEMYTLMRTRYRGGWVLEEGDSLSFVAAAGPWTMHYITGLGATIEVEGGVFTVPPDDVHRTVQVMVPRSGRVTIRCRAGAVNLDRMVRND